ncbi:MAG: 1-deoxy-D-xylulose-5-phosphate reductoisomerase [Gemmatimonadaceae bacterium]|nr:1-deoxy-D-xylulose-5-phosphate reductoisomerase [Gemmatimonadaceae bacterium]MBA3657872.1 1-deoxy-D-xylulose-5-phosphate reductoisomerase [Gemmatimonadaceae bacterium]
MRKQGIALLGSTGSIGTTALRVIARQQTRFSVSALTAFNNAPLLHAQEKQFAPSFVGIVNPGDVASNGWRVGAECLVEAATRPDADIVLNAIVGAAGLDATIAALRAGKRVALANKESLVIAGELVAAACREGGGELVPVDSEHSAILQCIAGRPRDSIRRVILTASGGPFRGWSHDQISRVTVAEALQHPTWKMGRKISVDSATLANKALEVIEAHFLFGIPYDRIEVVVHPQSIIHSFVEFVDGSVIAQMSVPTMELPVLYALTHPERVMDDGVPSFNPVDVSPMTFESVARDQFPALELGISAGKTGGAAPAVFNAANECAVARFLAGRIAFPDIPRAIESSLARLSGLPSSTRDDLLAADASARRHVEEMFKC